MLRLYKYVLVFTNVALFMGCSSDNATDPNDPKFEVPQDGISLNLNTTYQVIDHFGASGGFQDQWVGKWPDASRNKVAKWLFSTETNALGDPEGIGLSLWRTIIGEGSADQVNSGFKASNWFREMECYLAPDGTYDWNKQEGQRWFMSKAKEYGVDKFTAWTGSPPYFMTKNGYVFSTAEVPTFNCEPDKYDDFANFLADVVKKYEDDGYNITTVCPFNETQYEWNATVGEAQQSGTRATNGEVATVTRIIDGVFAQKGVNAKIMIPEAAQLKYLFEGSNNREDQVNDFFNTSSSNYIGDLDNLSKHIAGHSYFSNGTTSESLRQRKSLKTTVESYGLDYWQTEYSLLGTAYLNGREASDLSEIDYALWMSRIIHTDLVFGNATGWSFWTALNRSTFGDHRYRFNLVLWAPNSNGPSHTDGTVSDNKLLWALGNFSRFIRPGMVRFEINDPDYSDNASVENFMISGYKGGASNKDLVIVCINNTDSTRRISFENYGVDFEVVNDTFEAFTTSSGTNLKKSTMQYDGVDIPRKSIVTLKAVLK
ncbi:glycoside hydrolase [Seonamhaeicola aphaedonensis]|uniref:O-glycosyl hydrolase n=1 Tax=Seonamhaeicola aphaedonensis TaxID=1461338 RepID=A0A3D9HLE6_9FLAO|nr:glycoside hydrolase [Seonamhaeicola aphaedonensis]RED50332.1 O-glycosyl hydrolase [Seonamhaeicola aphaedonensis]